MRDARTRQPAAAAECPRSDSNHPRPEPRLLQGPAVRGLLFLKILKNHETFLAPPKNRAMIYGMNMKNNSGSLIPAEAIEQKIFVLREHRVMLDRDLAGLYGVSVKRLNEQVKRNLDRFPDDFMFQLDISETESVLSSRSQIATLKGDGPNLRSQIATSSWGGQRYRPYVFTEHGAVMLANVLKSPTAVRVGIQVVRAFIHLRQLVSTNEKLLTKVEALEKKVGEHDGDIKVILAAIRKLLRPLELGADENEKPPIGFHA